MIHVVKFFLRFITVLIGAVFLARYLVGSGLVRAGLNTSVGDKVYTELRGVFNVIGSEDAETLIVSVVLLNSLIVVGLSAWLLSNISPMYSSYKKTSERVSGFGHYFSELDITQWLKVIWDSKLAYSALKKVSKKF
ncbi:hypothetical protein SAMN05444065_12927 [Pseudomonas syringae]|uniref:Uncharacterized protein n=1 Tax=Pseudomonas syringae TaxID=317 RepID=A0AB38C106_PSESX|nr:hypothetical protein SAMN05444065_12927 [Pseudomonas syringae]SFO91096.1 hypothetical protein SAMN05444063_12827 [Pseudomonas syringae]